MGEHSAPVEFHALVDHSDQKRAFRHLIQNAREELKQGNCSTSHSRPDGSIVNMEEITTNLREWTAQLVALRLFGDSFDGFLCEEMVMGLTTPKKAATMHLLPSGVVVIQSESGRYLLHCDVESIVVLEAPYDEPSKEKGVFSPLHVTIRTNQGAYRWQHPDSEELEEAMACLSTIRTHFLERRASFHARMCRLLTMMEEAFDEGNRRHVQMIEQLWDSVIDSDNFPQTALDGQPSKGDQCGRDWSVMGFQRSDAPQSDFRGCGLLALHCLVFFCKEFTEEVRALLSAQASRHQGYPLSACAINVVKLLVEEMGISNSVKAGPDAVHSMQSSALFRLCVRLPRCEDAFESVFCETIRLMERLWVVNDCTYMDFPRVYSAMRKVLRETLEKHPSGIEALECVDVSEVRLPSHEDLAKSTSQGAR